jgi:ABC-type antimicrobial peptide transport system permease subunit
MALGADRWRIRRMILRSAGLLAAAGLAIGLAAAAGLTRFIEAQLFGVSAASPIVYGAVAAAVVVAAVVAAWRPASHAAGVDPAITLKAE